MIVNKVEGGGHGALCAMLRDGDAAGPRAGRLRCSHDDLVRELCARLSRPADAANHAAIGCVRDGPAI